jgi:undecaprenyl-diphosphatase
MTILDALVLAVVEGITEFLPISSTGHLILTSHLLGLEHTDFLKSFEVIIQLGAILAIVFLYWKTLIKDISIWKKIVTAFIPTAFVGFFLYDFIKGFLLGNETVTLASLFIGGIVLILLELFHKEKKESKDQIAKLSYKHAFIIGCFQSLSIIPGVSRAASTIIGGLLVGGKRKTAVEFSFLLAVPTMVAASGLDLLESNFSFTATEWHLLSVGFIGSFLVAIAAVKFFLGFIQKHTFIPFGVYRIVLALVYWLFLMRL